MMKRISEFKGTRTVTEFDAESGKFVEVSIGYPNFAPAREGVDAEIVMFKNRVGSRAIIQNRKMQKKMRQI